MSSKWVYPSYSLLSAVSYTISHFPLPTFTILPSNLYRRYWMNFLIKKVPKWASSFTRCLVSHVKEERDTLNLHPKHVRKKVSTSLRVAEINNTIHRQIAVRLPLYIQPTHNKKKSVRNKLLCFQSLHVLIIICFISQWVFKPKEKAQDFVPASIISDASN